MSSNGKLIIDGREIDIQGEKNLLEIIRRAGINLPTFCYHSELSIYGACRLCLVETDKMGLVAACSTPPQEGMVIRTNTLRTRRLRKMVIELLLANHERECTTCSRSGRCKLQLLAHQLGVKEVRFGKRDKKVPLDLTSPSIVRDPNKCILCGDCVRMCKEVQGLGIWDFAHRGSKTVVTTAFDKELSDVACVNCGQCVSVCPTGALTVKSEIDKVWNAIHDPDKIVVAQIAPAVRVALGEEFGLNAGEDVTGKIVAGLKLIGVGRVFDTLFTADMTTIEEANELLVRLEKNENLPIFTSCCPAWVKYCEQFHADLLPNVSSCRSPQQMFGSVVKKYYAKKLNKRPEDVFVLSIMPCVAKKFEAQRPEFTTGGVPDVDAVLTTVEIAQMFKEASIDFTALPNKAFDNPLGVGSGAALIFGASGGVMESVVRYVSGLTGGDEVGRIDFLPVRGMEGIKKAYVKAGGKILKLAVVNGLANTEKLISMLKSGEASFDAIEVMSCPGGCVGGGGQPEVNDTVARTRRAGEIYEMDRVQQLHKPQDNYFVVKAFEEWFGGVNNHETHHALHTTYVPRRRINGKPFIMNDSQSQRLQVSVCLGTGCYLRGAYDVIKEFNDLAENRGIAGQIEINGTFCLEKCDNGVSVNVNDEIITGVSPENAGEIFINKISPLVDKNLR
ncbi:[FeFe] hydrogenase, group A [Pelotomaculum propionicicum]|uniref:NADP-reducing hydrogenase subunit HndC n=1 Tax=Pelotomaculum propionicicum TaxID=258475 RepID=A0A4Y7RNY3_9FIRM|nr:[FeFe] hydrogenase, group A [Pelotomaculum propionicicum]NLI12320.1 4Fe-4S dicluster domain-containing protein [Peptococcaceae bacterium]TEB10449.1 NADP-reducing hydrogenase subunit HndC [Pelotomaculum propionicicum]